MKPYHPPVACILLYLGAAGAVVLGIVLLLAQQGTAAIACFVSGFSLLAWGQMLDAIARAAHYAEQTAAAVADLRRVALAHERLEADKLRPPVLPPAAPAEVWPAAPERPTDPAADRALTILREVEQSQRAMKAAMGAGRPR